MLVIFSRTKDDPLYSIKHGPLKVIVKEPCSHKIIETKQGKMLKIKISKKNTYDPLLVKVFGISFTSEWIYIPMEYVKRIKEGVSTKDYFKRGF